MRKALIVIDYQNDFVADDGKLTCGKMAQDIEGNICKLIDESLASGTEVICTYDTHDDQEYLQTKEGKIFPKHCLVFSPGWKLFGRVVGYKNVIHEYKNTFSICPERIAAFLNRYSEITFCGVATNICVLQNAISFYNIDAANDKNITFKVVENACASFDRNEHEHAIAYMRDVLGFEVI